MIETYVRFEMQGEPAHTKAGFSAPKKGADSDPLVSFLETLWKLYHLNGACTYCRMTNVIIGFLFKNEIESILRLRKKGLDPLLRVSYLATKPVAG
jgi:hypothetical protein